MSEYTPEHRADDQDPVVGDAPPQANVLLSNSVYDTVKFIAVLLLPALGALYFGLAGIWGLPKAEEVVGTIVVLDTFLGVLLQISTKQYLNSDARFDGAIQIEQLPKGEAVTNVLLDSSAIHAKNEIVVRVNRK